MDKRNDTDILRAEDVIPPFNQEQEPPQEQSSDTETATQNTNEIPKFDLAKQIMAEHRKNASSKRKAPKSVSQRPLTKGRRFQITPEYNGVQNVIERAFLSHQNKQSAFQKPEREPVPNIPEKVEIKTLGPGSGLPTTAIGAGWSPNSYSDMNETRKIISDIVARDIKKLLNGNISI